MSDNINTITADYFPDEQIDAMLDMHRQDFRDALRAVLTNADFFSLSIAEGSTNHGIKMQVVAIVCNEALAIILASVAQGIADSNRMVAERSLKAIADDYAAIPAIPKPKPQ